MAAIKPIEARSVHQIQSGQVIIDLCSVVKELVENSLDAGATSLEVRFKNYGLDAVEVQDNGGGISPSNWDALALKHHTSKLGSYDDLSSLETFGFRGEALSSLCALANFYVVTASSDEAPKGNRLDFEHSGKLKNATVVAAQSGTTAYVEGLFEHLPVRRKELTKNIKKEYGKALGLLHAYACIGTEVKFTVKSSMPKAKTAVVFTTKGNPTTKENIANVYGAKTLSALVPLDLQVEFRRSPSHGVQASGGDHRIKIRGHVSRPVFGEGRQTPDRQMFFVNGRPCGLPQIAKAFNEVYKSFNVSQSPFVFADLAMDTNSYDVNVSPDKRTIMLHDSASLVESLKSSLTELFEQQQQIVPHSQVQRSHLPAYPSLTADEPRASPADRSRPEAPPSIGQPENLRKISNEPFDTQAPRGESLGDSLPEALGSETEAVSNRALEEDTNCDLKIDYDQEIGKRPDVTEIKSAADTEALRADNCVEGRRISAPGHALSCKVGERQPPAATSTPVSSPPQHSVIQNAFDRMRPNRPGAELATITVGDKTMTTVVGRHSHKLGSIKGKPQSKALAKRPSASASTQAFTQKLKGFAASAVPVSTDDVEHSETEMSGSSDQIPGSGESQDGDKDFNASHEDGSETASLASGPSYAQPPNVDERDTEVLEKEAQDAIVAELIRAAEEKAASVNEKNVRRVNKGLRPVPLKDSTTSLQFSTAISMDQIEAMASAWQRTVGQSTRQGPTSKNADDDEVANEEERLTLTLSKTDFPRMHIVGQFNLGFILAVRTAIDTNFDATSARVADELFIIDQHASDEKFNFEKLQEETVVGNQRLVRPKQLELTAVEEEILIENIEALKKNGFLVSVDTSGDEPIGQRCKLTSIPLSKQVVFGLEDLEELLHLLGESPTLSQSASVPRPGKVRKMFAMRACRSSIMIGKSLTQHSMRDVVSHMGELDKPWNCPHGRPTMRHLVSLDSFQTWQEGDGTGGGQSDNASKLDIWRNYA